MRLVPVELNHVLRNSILLADELSLQTNARISRRESEKPKTGARIVCRHRRVSEIGEDSDRDGRLIRLVRCQKCGLLIRESMLYTVDDCAVEDEESWMDRA